MTYQEGIAVDPFNAKFYQEGAKIAAELDENEQANALYKEGLENIQPTLFWLPAILISWYETEMILIILIC